MFASNLPYRYRKPRYISKSKQNMAVMASDGPSPTSLPCVLAFPPPSNRDANTPSPCWAPHFMTQECIMFSNPTPNELHPSPAARHAVGSHAALALRLYIAACNPSSSCRFWALHYLCSHLSQSFHFCWITEIRFLNLCVCFYLFFICLHFSDRNELQLPCLQFGRYHQSDSTITFSWV